MLRAVAENTRVVFIANPNNPTGTWVSAAELRKFLECVSASVIVVVDEAYFEYVNEPDYPNAMQWVEEFPNLLVTRTFSKAYGLASLRVGYGVSQPELADLLNRVRQPFNVNSLAQLAAVAALVDDEHLQKSIRVNQEGMAQLTQGFESLGLAFVPSVGNFIALQIGENASAVYEGLLREGVIVRPVDNYAMPGYLRISIGLAEENNRLLRALGKVIRL
jgi:histidinol-phosphate aminotransferase